MNESSSHPPPACAGGAESTGGLASSTSSYSRSNGGSRALTASSRCCQSAVVDVKDSSPPRQRTPRFQPTDPKFGSLQSSGTLSYLRGESEITAFNHHPG